MATTPRNDEPANTNASSHADLSNGLRIWAKTFMLVLVEMEVARRWENKESKYCTYIQVESRVLISSPSSLFHLRLPPP